MTYVASFLLLVVMLAAVGAAAYLATSAWVWFATG